MTKHQWKRAYCMCSPRVKSNRSPHSWGSLFHFWLVNSLIFIFCWCSNLANSFFFCNTKGVVKMILLKTKLQYFHFLPVPPVQKIKKCLANHLSFLRNNFHMFPHLFLPIIHFQDKLGISSVLLFHRNIFPLSPFIVTFYSLPDSIMFFYKLRNMI